MDNSAVNSNTVVMTYSKQSDTKTVKFNTFDVNLKKTDDTESSYDSTTGESTSPKTLAGAKFKVYTAATGGTALKFKKDATAALDVTVKNVDLEEDELE